MRVPVQTSFGLALLPLPVTVDEDVRRGARSGASERAREEAFYQGFPEGRSHASERRPRSEWKVFARLVSLRSGLWRRLSSLKWSSRRAAPSHRG